MAKKSVPQGRHISQKISWDQVNRQSLDVLLKAMDALP